MKRVSRPPDSKDYPGPVAKPGTDLPLVSAYRWLALPPEELLRACAQARFQGSGPGGQKRNRVYSGVRLTHTPSGLTAESVDSRASLRNLHAALARLRMGLALSASLPGGDLAGAGPGFGTVQAGISAVRPDFRSDLRAELLANFRADANPAHVDFPLFTLRALDLLARHRGQLASAATALECTASALTRFFKSDKAVWARVRAIRTDNGLHPLK